jgi:hypothetical protein
MALIPVFIGFEILLTDGHRNQKMRSREQWREKELPIGGFCGARNKNGQAEE